MNNSNYRFTLDIQSNLSQVLINVKLLDTARRFIIGLTDGGVPYTIADGSVAVLGYKKAEPNENGVYEADICECEIEDSTIKFELNAGITNAVGTVNCEIRLYTPQGKLFTTPKFIIVVHDRVVEDEDIEVSEEGESFLDSIFKAEVVRVNAEAERVEAETARQVASEEAISNANTAADNAQAIADELTEKLEAGEFQGEPGVPGVNGKDGENGKDGKDYILTSADKTEIANIVLANFPIAEEISV